jgi:hypothetical protein
MKTERKVAIYARVSTNSGQNSEMQIRELREYCTNRGWKIAGEYTDSGISGATDSRHQLDRLMASLTDNEALGSGGVLANKNYEPAANWPGQLAAAKAPSSKPFTSSVRTV